MISWLLKGVLRDKTRSLFPFLVVTAGVALVIFFIGFMDGIFSGMIDMTANLDTGHLRFVNKPFYEEEHLNPLDRALGSQSETLQWLKANSDPRIQWTPRIRWGAILDVPDDKGETLSQTPVMGMALDLLSPNSPELKRLRLRESLLRGKLPNHAREMLVGYQLAKTLGVEPGQIVTLLGQSFDGGLATDNYRVVGMIRFGVAALDKKMVLIDLKDAQNTFYMANMVTDWLGFLPTSVSWTQYDFLRDNIRKRMKELRTKPMPEWAPDDYPIVLSIFDQRNMSNMMKTYSLVKKILVGIFILLMTLVLWNAGLLNGIHRYGEMGLMLAFGETHGQLLLLLIMEAFLLGIFGCVAGSLVGGGVVLYLQEVGINMGDAFAKTGLMVNDVARGRLSLEAFLYGVVPGILASVLGYLIAGAGIFQRSEANLFRELEAG